MIDERQDLRLFRVFIQWLYISIVLVKNQINITLLMVFYNLFIEANMLQSSRFQSGAFSRAAVAELVDALDSKSGEQ